jgi:hypothetical protein
LDAVSFNFLEYDLRLGWLSVDPELALARDDASSRDSHCLSFHIYADETGPAHRIALFNQDWLTVRQDSMSDELAGQRTRGGSGSCVFEDPERWVEEAGVGGRTAADEVESVEIAALSVHGP